MKILKYINCCVLSCLVALAISSCTTEKKEMEKHHFEDKLFINTEELTKDVLFKPASADIVKKISMSSAKQAEKTISGTFKAQPELVSDYNKAYANPGEEAEVFPVENCEIANATVTINKGANLSTDAVITFKNIATLNRDLVYVLPIELVDVKGLDVLDSKSVVYYVFKGASLINVVADIAKNNFPVQMGAEGENLSVVTVECLINVRDFGNCNGEKGMAMSSVFGIEGHFLVRIGDAGFPSNQVQLVTPNGNFPNGNSELGLPTNEWVHIAAVYDTNTGQRIMYTNGKKVAEDNNASKLVNLTNDCFIGKAYNDERWLNGCISELRVWNVQRTEEEIANNFYEVNPASEGLIGYWKFNEGNGTTVKDHSKFGNDVKAAFEENLSWKNVSLPAKKTEE